MEVFAAGVAVVKELGAPTVAVEPHHCVVAAEVVVVEVAAVVGPVEVEAGCRENVVVEFASAAAAATDPLLVHVVLLSVGLSPTASLDDSYLDFRGFRGFVAVWRRQRLRCPRICDENDKSFPQAV
jgi:hypothetical protein